MPTRVTSCRIKFFVWYLFEYACHKLTCLHRTNKQQATCTHVTPWYSIPSPRHKIYSTWGHELYMISSQFGVSTSLPNACRAHGIKNSYFPKTGPNIAKGIPICLHAHIKSNPIYCVDEHQRNIFGLGKIMFGLCAVTSICVVCVSCTLCGTNKCDF